MLDNNSKIKLLDFVGINHQIPHIDVPICNVWGMRHLYDERYSKVYVYDYTFLVGNKLYHLYVGKGKDLRDISRYGHPLIWLSNNVIIYRISGVNPDDYDKLEGYLIKHLKPFFNRRLTGQDQEWVDDNLPKNAAINFTRCLRHFVVKFSCLLYE